MNRSRFFAAAVASAFALLLAACGTPGAPRPSHSAKIGPRPASAKPDPLTAWTDNSPAKLALGGFVESTIAEGSPVFVPPAERVAVLSTDLLGLASTSPAPVRQLVSYLRSSGYRVYFVTDGDPEPFRTAARDAVGAAPDDVIGSYPEASYVVRDGRPLIVASAQATPTPKPVVIHRFVGRRPVLAVGASEADLPMMEYTTLANPGPCAAFLIGAPSPLASQSTKRGWALINPSTDWIPAKR